MTIARLRRPTALSIPSSQRPRPAIGRSLWDVPLTSDFAALGACFSRVNGPFWRHALRLERGRRPIIAAKFRRWQAHSEHTTDFDPVLFRGRGELFWRNDAIRHHVTPPKTAQRFTTGVIRQSGVKVRNDLAVQSTSFSVKAGASNRTGSMPNARYGVFVLS